MFSQDLGLSFTQILKRHSLLTTATSALVPRPLFNEARFSAYIIEKLGVALGRVLTFC